MRILMITDHLPYPPYSGTAIRNYNLMKRIARKHDVWLATFADDEGKNGVDDLLEFCRRVDVVDAKKLGGLAHPIDALRYLLAGIPIELRLYKSDALIEKIRRITADIDFDVIEIVDSHMGLYLDSLPVRLHTRTILTFIDVVFSKYERISRLEPKLSRRFRSWLFARMMRRWEPIYGERFGRCITVSESDRRLLLSSNPRLTTTVIPNGIDTNICRPLPYLGNEPALIFVGNMAYRPNIDAMIYFCRRILPIIRSKIPQAELWIAGINPAQEVIQLAGNGIHVTGRIADVRPFYRKSMACVVPLQAGGGTRLKILESMAFGRPVVSTSIGCEGLDVVDSEHLLIADSPEEFAYKTLYLLTDKDLMRRIVVQARQFVVNHYDWDVISQKLVQTYEEVSS